jgi:hypothetical protein
MDEATGQRDGNDLRVIQYFQFTYSVQRIYNSSSPDVSLVYHETFFLVTNKLINFTMLSINNVN